MAEVEEQIHPHVCSIFEGQTWRRSLCKNCFHTLEEHSDELLAKEAEAVAKERAVGKTSAAGTMKPAVLNAKSPSTVDAKNVNKTGSSREKEKSPRDVKGKLSAKDSRKDDGKLLLEKKTTKPGTPTKAEYEKHETTSGSSTPTSIKASPKSSPMNIKPATSAPSTQTATTNNITPAASGTNSPFNSQKSLLTKTKNPVTAAEQKQLLLSKDKLPKPPDTLTKPSNTLTSNKPNPSNSTNSKLAGKSVELSQSPVSKSDPKSPRNISEDTKLAEMASKNVKAGASKVSSPKLVDVKNENCTSDANKNTKNPQLVTKSEIKDAKSPPVGSKPESTFTKTPSLPRKPQIKDAKAPLLVIKSDSKDSTSSLSPSKSDRKDAKTSSPPSKADSKDAKTPSPPSKADSKDAKSLPLATKSDSKDVKTPLQSSKPDIKDFKLVNGTRSKTPLFGKDSLKNVKDATKQMKSPDPMENKTNLPQVKDNGITNTNGSSKEPTTTTNEKDKAIPGSKYSPVKFTDREKQQENESSTLKSSTKLKCGETSLVSNQHNHVSSPSNPDTAELNTNGFLVKASDKSPKANNPGNTESKEISKSTNGSGGRKREPSPFSSPSNTEVDKGVNSKDRGKEKACERKNEPVADSSISGRKALSSTTTTQSSRGAVSSNTKSSSSTISIKAAENKAPKTLKLYASKDPKPPIGSVDKSTVSEKVEIAFNDKDSFTSSVKSPTFPSAETLKTKEDPKEADKYAAPSKHTVDVKEATKLTAELKDKEVKLEAMTQQLSKMIKQVKALEEERDHLNEASSNNHKKGAEAMLINLREQLSNLESQCITLEKDNQSLIDQLRAQETVKKQSKESGNNDLNNVNLEEDLEAAEKELEDVKEVNKELQTQIMEMKCEMDEMYDHFRENEHEEFREMQKDLDMTAKTCRILQFKLRKAERRNEQFEEERIRYEEKLRMLQDQFDSKDAKNHIRILEEELRVVKEVSVRLHDELDIVEDKRNKALDDNRHLTDLLEHTDRRQFRLEMEIDKLRDIVAELKQQLSEAKSRNTDNNTFNKELSPDKKVHSTIYTRSID